MTETTLATRCPHCHTRFRVSHAVLDLRDGAVRCGVCHQVFNGRTHGAALASSTVMPDRSEVIAEVTSESPEAGNADAKADFNALASGPMATMGFSGSAPGSTAKSGGTDMLLELDALSKAITDLQAQPRHTPTEVHSGQYSLDEEAPGFIKAARKKQRTARAWAILLGLGIPLLLFALAAQLTYHFRSEIAARLPQVAPLLKRACEQLACTIDLPANIDVLSLQSSQLQAVAGEPDQFELIALIRNRSQTVQAWPAFELLLNDEDGQAQVRKVLLPAEFLAQQALTSGIDAYAEREIRIKFSLSNASATGFELVLFYP